MWNRLLVFLGFSGEPALTCGASPPRFSHDDLYHVALDVLHPILSSRCCMVGTLEGAAETQREIERLRAWVRGLEDKRVRYHYNSWLDHFQNELRHSVHDLLTDQRKHEMEKYQEREHDKAVRRAPAKEWIPKPPDPEIPSAGKSVQ